MHRSADVYWTSYGVDSVVKMPLDGGTPTTLASGQVYAHNLTVDATSVYWATLGDGQDNGAVMRLGSCQGAVCK